MLDKNGKKVFCSHGHRPFNAPWDGVWKSLMHLSFDKAEMLMDGCILAKDFRIIGQNQGRVVALYNTGRDYILMMTDDVEINIYVEDNIDQIVDTKDRKQKVYSTLLNIAKKIHRIEQLQQLQKELKTEGG